MKFTNLLLGLALAGPLTAAGAYVSADAPHAHAAQAAPAQNGKAFTHEGAGVTFNVPPGWKAEPDGNQLTVSPEDESVALVFWVTEEEDFDAAAKALGEELAKTIKNLKFDGEPKADKHNGMDHASVSGTGQVDGKDIVFSADILEAKKPLIVLTLGSLESIEKHAEQFAQLVKSIKKVG